jgi:uncharacterized damage-inducible protein DinB
VSRSLLDDAFSHHIWATARLIDACLGLSAEQLETKVPGTYGSIIGTLRHLVDGDAFYLYGLTGDRVHVINTEGMDLRELQSAIKTNGAAWSRLLAQHPDPDAITLERDDDGFTRRATMGIRFAQALYHGTDHRSQVCTTLTQLGMEPPDIQVWEYGKRSGRSVESMPDERLTTPSPV